MRKVFLIIAVVLMVLVALAIAAFFGARSVVSKVVGNGDDSSVFNYSSPSSYSVGDAEIRDDISSLTINWLSGEVRVEEYEGSRVVIKDEVTMNGINSGIISNLPRLVILRECMVWATVISMVRELTPMKIRVFIG